MRPPNPVNPVNLVKIAGIEIAVERKAIKHTHFSVFPPDARVHVSAPLELQDADLRSFLLSKVPWMRKQIAAVLAQPRQTRWREIRKELNDFIALPLGEE